MCPSHHGDCYDKDFDEEKCVHLVSDSSDHIDEDTAVEDPLFSSTNNYVDSVINALVTTGLGHLLQE